MAETTMSQPIEPKAEKTPPVSHEETAQALAVVSLLIFGGTILPPIVAGLFTTLSPDFIKFVEQLASIEIGPIGVVFGFYFSTKLRS